MTAVLDPPVRQQPPVTVALESRKPSGPLWKVATRGRAVDSWAVMLGGAHGHAEELLAQVESRINETKVPAVRLERAMVAPGMVRGVLGGKRDFLVISDRRNRRLKRLQLFLGVRDYGTNLDVFWYLMHRRGLTDWLFIAMLLVPGLNLFVLPFFLLRERRGTINLDLFDESDLRAYVTNAHHCLLDAVDKLLLALGQDASRINRQSRGFLGIS